MIVVCYILGYLILGQYQRSELIFVEHFMYRQSLINNGT